MAGQNKKKVLEEKIAVFNKIMGFDPTHPDFLDYQFNGSQHANYTLYHRIGTGIHAVKTGPIQYLIDYLEGAIDFKYGRFAENSIYMARQFQLLKDMEYEARIQAAREVIHG